MLDRLHFFVPFRSEHVQIVYAGAELDGSTDEYFVDLKTLGVRLSGSIYYGKHGAAIIDDLRHPFESLPSSFTGMALKVYPTSCGQRKSPGIELKASPAKLLQGHNVFGPSCIEGGFMKMLEVLAGVYPHLAEMLDFPASQLISLDATYSARLPDEATALQAIQAMQGVSSGQTKARGDSYRTTVYFGAKTSRAKRIKAYLKKPEFDHQLQEMAAEAKRMRFAPESQVPESVKSARRVLEVMQDPRLQAWASNLLRLEVTVLKRFLENRGLPFTMVALIELQRTYPTPDLFLQFLWREATAELFKAFEGATMKIITDDRVRKSLLDSFTTVSEKTGKQSTTKALSAFRTYRMIRDYGYNEAMVSMSRATFYRHVDMITQCGIAKATLQQLSDHEKANNVVPLIRFLTVDFGQQLPDWYVDPLAA